MNVASELGRSIPEIWRDLLSTWVAMQLDYHKTSDRMRAAGKAAARADAIGEAIQTVDSYADSIGNPSANIVAALEQLKGEPAPVGQQGGE
jgi:hypothetical protein